MIRALRSPTWWVGMGLAAVAVYIMAESVEWSLGGKLFPWVVGSIVLSACILHAAIGAVRGVRATVEEEGEPGIPVDPKHRLAVFAWIAGFLLALPVLGFAVTLPLFVIAFMIHAGEKWWLAVLVAAGVWAFVFLVLVEIVYVNLPRSYLQHALGW